jgi:hypothetical protein
VAFRVEEKLTWTCVHFLYYNLKSRRNAGVARSSRFCTKKTLDLVAEATLFWATSDSMWNILSVAFAYLTLDTALDGVYTAL